MDKCTTLLNSLQSSVTEMFSVRSVGSVCVVSTPFFYYDRRQLTVIAEQMTDGSIELSDDGYGHFLARVSGVSEKVFDSVKQSAAQHFGVEVEDGEVVARVNSADGVLDGIVALIEGSQYIATAPDRKRLQPTTNYLDRKIARALVAESRVYERHVDLPVSGGPITVDFNVIPSDEFKQLSLFSLNEKTTRQRAESMAYRINTLQSAPTNPEFSGRILVIEDESGHFRAGNQWSRIRDTLRNTNVEMVSITDTARIKSALVA